MAKGGGQNNKAGTTIVVGKIIAVGTMIAAGGCTGLIGIGTNRPLFMHLRRFFMPRSRRRASASFSLRSAFDKGILYGDRRLLTAVLHHAVVSNRARQDKCKALKYKSMEWRNEKNHYVRDGIGDGIGISLGLFYTLL